MAEIVDKNMRQQEKDILDATIMIPDREIMPYIYDNPEAVLADDDFILEHIIDNGYHCSALVEALGLLEIIIKVKGIEYKMFYQPPSPFFTHYDVMFNTDKFKKYMGRTRRAAFQVEKAMDKPVEKLKGDILYV